MLNGTLPSSQVLKPAVDPQKMNGLLENGVCAENETLLEEDGHGKASILKAPSTQSAQLESGGNGKCCVAVATQTESFENSMFSIGESGSVEDSDESEECQERQEEESCAAPRPMEECLAILKSDVSF